jgi:hypothetical protein
MFHTNFLTMVVVARSTNVVLDFSSPISTVDQGRTVVFSSSFARLFYHSD